MCYINAAMGIFGLRLELRTLRAALEKLRYAIKEQSETIHEVEERNRHEKSVPGTFPVVVRYDDKTARDTQSENDRQFRNQSSMKWDLLRDADRPWIAVDVSITSPLTYDGRGVSMEFNIIPKNVGRSPAQNIWLSPKLVPAFMGDDVSKTQKLICENAQPPLTGLQSYVLFAGDHYVQPEGLGLSAEEINAHWGKLPPGMHPPDGIPLVPIGCVDYTYTSSPRHHQTGFALDVLMKSGLLVQKSQTPVAPEMLLLRDHSFGGHFAN